MLLNEEQRGLPSAGVDGGEVADVARGVVLGLRTLDELEALVREDRGAVDDAVIACHNRRRAAEDETWARAADLLSSITKRRA